ncbi:MAG: pyridoxamine 5'-phosphate oxidase family protein [Janthinobacterium lividum]
MSDKTHSEATKKMWSMMKDIGFAMMTTEDGDNLRARPMVAAQKEFDGSLWFYTRASSHKVDEVQGDQRVGITYAEPSKQNYVSLSGKARLVRDKAAITEHWQESMRTWFPKGTDDPEIALLRVEITEAEYWDAPSSTMIHAYGYVKAVVTGEPPHPGGNEKLSFA